MFEIKATLLIDATPGFLAALGSLTGATREVPPAALMETEPETKKEPEPKTAEPEKAATPPAPEAKPATKATKGKAAPGPKQETPPAAVVPPPPPAKKAEGAVSPGEFEGLAEEERRAIVKEKVKKAQLLNKQTDVINLVREHGAQFSKDIPVDALASFNAALDALLAGGDSDEL
jgi:hypothetical protein